MVSVRTRLLLCASLLLAACESGTQPVICEVGVNLQRGEVLISRPPEDEPGCGLLLPSGSVGDRYRVAILRLDSAGAGSTPSVILRVEALGGSGAPAPAPVSAPAAPAVELPAVLLAGLEAGSATGRFHEALRRDEEAMVARMGAQGILRGAREAVARAPAPSPATRDFDQRTVCTGSRTARSGILLGENDVLEIYQDASELPHQRLSDVHVQRMLSFYSAYGKPTVESYGGKLPDVDGNAKVTVFATAAAFSDPDVVAFVWAGNFYERETCSASDEADVIFFNPARIRSMESGEYVALGVLSHESQHLVSLFHRLARTRRRNSSTFLSHPVWMEEGRAEIADEATSRRAWAAVGGPAANAVVRREDLVRSGQIGGRCCIPEAYGVALQAARTVWYLSSQPNGLVVTPTGGNPNADIRNGAWHFHRWLGDGYGNAASAPAADASLFRRLTDSLSASGSDGLREVVGEPFDELLEAFTAAVMLHRTDTSPAVPGFGTYDFVSLTGGFTSPGLNPPGEYPWPVTTRVSGGDTTISASFESATWVGPIGPTGMRIHDFVSDGEGPGALVRVGGLGSSNARLVVIRIR